MAWVTDAAAGWQEIPFRQRDKQNKRRRRCLHEIQSASRFPFPCSIDAHTHTYTIMIGMQGFVFLSLTDHMNERRQKGNAAGIGYPLMS
jgi:hypothetical protein